jgi:hypothetical protein
MKINALAVLEFDLDELSKLSGKPVVQLLPELLQKVREEIRTCWDEVATGYEDLLTVDSVAAYVDLDRQ